MLIGTVYFPIDCTHTEHQNCNQLGFSKRLWEYSSRNDQSSGDFFVQEEK